MKLTILMYHRVEEPPPYTAHPSNFVDPSQLAAQLTALREWGYTSVSFDDWIAHLAGQRSLPSRPLILTFDDGYRSLRDIAWPIVREHGFSATTFLVSTQIGGTNRWDADEPQAPLLNAGEIRALRAEGMSFGSHSRTHRPLARIPIAEAAEEMSRSRAELEAILGEPVRVLAYPFSNQSRDVRHAARDAGYAAAVRGLGRMNTRRTDRFGLRRIKIDFEMSISRLRWKLFRERWLR